MSELSVLPATGYSAPHLPLLRLELVFRMLEPVTLPAFRGNLWRGILGPALKRIDDGLMPGLDTGRIPAGRLYSTFFESPPPPDASKMRLYANAPHPYVIDAPPTSGPRELATGDTEVFHLTLIGHAAGAADAVLGALDFAARVGIGSRRGDQGQRGRALLTRASAVWRDDGATVFDEASGFRPVAPQSPPIPPAPSRLRVTLATPLRIVREGRLVGPRDFSPAALFSSLVRRVSMFMTFHTDASLETDFAGLKALARRVRAEDRWLAFADQHRWSGSQEREVDMGGIVGSFVMDLRGVEPLFPYLWLGQWIGAGKGTVLGMGAIRLKAD